MYHVLQVSFVCTKSVSLVTLLTIIYPATVLPKDSSPKKFDSELTTFLGGTPHDPTSSRLSDRSTGLSLS